MSIFQKFHIWDVSMWRWFTTGWIEHWLYNQIVNKQIVAIIYFTVQNLQINAERYILPLYGYMFFYLKRYIFKKFTLCSRYEKNLIDWYFFSFIITFQHPTSTSSKCLLATGSGLDGLKDSRIEQTSPSSLPAGGGVTAFTSIWANNRTGDKKLENKNMQGFCEQIQVLL